MWRSFAELATLVQPSTHEKDSDRIHLDFNSFNSSSQYAFQAGSANPDPARERCSRGTYSHFKWMPELPFDQRARWYARPRPVRTFKDSRYARSVRDLAVESHALDAFGTRSFKGSRARATRHRCGRPLCVSLHNPLFFSPRQFLQRRQRVRSQAMRQLT